jgi:hypothetical protein
MRFRREVLLEQLQEARLVRGAEDLFQFFGDLPEPYTVHAEVEALLRAVISR